MNFGPILRTTYRYATIMTSMGRGESTNSHFCVRGSVKHTHVGVHYVYVPYLMFTSRENEWEIKFSSGRKMQKTDPNLFWCLICGESFYTNCMCTSKGKKGFSVTTFSIHVLFRHSFRENPSSNTIFEQIEAEISDSSIFSL